MRLCCCSFDALTNRIVDNKMFIIMFGAGAIGQVTVPEILNRYQILDKIDCYLDNNETMWGGEITASGRKFLVKSPRYLNECSSQTLIFLNVSRFSDVILQLEGMDCTKDMECYIMPMMLIHNYCSAPSRGNPVMLDSPLIPKKLHYMWLGRNPIPESLNRCIESWKRYCPDYEIIEWNEDNYDISKHPYMKQAYENEAYGFVPDYARLDILYNEGGLYLDTDVEIKRNIDDLLYQEAFCGVEKWQVINFGGLSGAVKGHPVVKRFLDAREDVFFIDKNGKQNKNTCGFYDTRVAIDAGYRIDGTTQNVGGMNIYSYDYFQPYDYMSGILNETENTHSVHWFNGGWLNEKMKSANEATKRNYLKLYKRAVKETTSGSKMSTPKYHHRIPQTYMKAWCDSGDTVCLYDKRRQRSDMRNIGSIMGVNYFHAIKAGSIFTTSEALEKIFEPLDGLNIYDVDEEGEREELKSKKELNDRFYNYNNWIIKDSFGKDITRKQRNILYGKISQASDNSIEEAWSKKYENGWTSVISEIQEKVVNIHNHKSGMLSTSSAEVIMDYFVMFLWRSSRGYDEAKTLFDWMMNMIPEISYMKTENPVHRGDKTVAEEMWHNFLLSKYSQFLNDSGVMKMQRDAYFDKLTFLFLIDPEERFITSDNPCFEFTNKNGFKEPVLIALPGLIISLAKKDEVAPNSYKICEVSDDDVEYYNRVIFANGNQIISKTELDRNFLKSVLG